MPRKRSSPRDCRWPKTALVAGVPHLNRRRLRSPDSDRYRSLSFCSLEASNETGNFGMPAIGPSPFIKQPLKLARRLNLLHGNKRQLDVSGERLFANEPCGNGLGNIVCRVPRSHSNELCGCEATTPSVGFPESGTGLQCRAHGGKVMRARSA